MNVKKTCPAVFGFEDRERGPGAKNVGHLWQLERSRKGLLPWSLQRATQPCQSNKNYVGLLTYSTKDNKFYAFKLLNLWQFITSVIEN